MDEHPSKDDAAPAAARVRAKHESGAVAREEDLSPLRPDGTRRRILTGDRTTGKLHIGHWVGSLRDRVRLQHVYDTFILMADVQALTTHYDRPEVLKQSVWDVALDYLAAGIDPDVATIVVQSLVPQIADLTVYYGLLVPVRSLVDNPTTKAEAEAHGFELDTRNEDDFSEFPYEYRDRAIDLANRIQTELAKEHPPITSASPGSLLKVIGNLEKTSDKVIADELKYQLDLYDEYLENIWEPPDDLDPTFRQVPLPEHRQLVERELVRLERTWKAVEGSKMLERLVVETTLSSQRQRGFTSITYGFLGYPISQAADITFVDADLVPVGPDQVPLIELCREVCDRFNNMYGGAGGPARQDSQAEAGTAARPTEILRKPQALLGTTELIRGIDGSAKMSKSMNNAVYLSETDAEIWDKLRPAPTDPQRVRKTDPGRPEMCNVFAYHSVFNGTREPAIDEAAIGAVSVAEVAENCRGAKWGCIDCKKNLAIKLTALLDPMRARRAQWEAQPHKVKEILLAGTERAKAEGEKTLERVRSAMHMDYFD